MLLKIMIIPLGVVKRHVSYKDILTEKQTFF